MPDEAEYAKVAKLYREAALATKELRREKALPLGATLVHEMFRPVRIRYEELTGMKDCNENAVNRLHDCDTLAGCESRMVPKK
jgi:hypothetical protein